MKVGKSGGSAKNSKGGMKGRDMFTQHRKAMKCKMPKYGGLKNDTQLRPQPK